MVLTLLPVLLYWLTPGVEPPPPRDLDRFPPAAVVAAYRAAGWEHLQWLRQRVPLDYLERQELAAWLPEAEWCYRVWDALDDAQRCADAVWADPAFGVRLIRGHLSRLRDLLGWDCYYSSRMPPPVPVWRFRRIER